MLGHKPIITLDADDADELVIAAEQAFDYLLPASISENSWRFACTITELAEINNEIPPTHWNKVYMLPAGYIGNIRIYPQNYAYEIYADQKVYSTWTGKVYMEHLFLPDISRLPPWFVKMFVLELAAWLCLSNAQKTEYYTVLENKKTVQLAIAMGLDAKNRPNYEFRDFPMLNITSGEQYLIEGN
jgi:hypothetical protein